MTHPHDGPLLALYRAATALFGVLAAPAYLRRRQRRGKEDGSRLGERLGHAGRPRPEGPLVWLHGASVGEGLALLPLVERLVATGLHVLVTTGTVTSARILAERLPAGATHQFVPLDIPAALGRFLDAWRPDLCLLAESELWPNLIVAVTRRAIPIALVNARLSRRSFTRWRRLLSFIGPLLRRIDLCVAQSAADADRLAALGARRVTVAGNLKFDAEPPPADAAGLAHLREAIGTRPTWLAASTHAEEEPAILAVHRRLAARHPGLLTLVVPRQAKRGAGLAAQAVALGVPAGLRSRGEPLRADTQLYVADTMGELGLFFRLARIVFMGKSLGGGGGQNPIEPARLGCAILHGPAVGNFAEVYGLFDAAGGALAVADAEALAAGLSSLLDDEPARAAVAEAAAGVVRSAGGVTARTVDALARLLPVARA